MNLSKAATRAVTIPNWLRNIRRLPWALREARRLGVDDARSRLRYVRILLRRGPIS
jgi:hypothetical protein